MATRMIAALTRPQRAGNRPKKVRPASAPAAHNRPRIQAAVELAIDEQRESLETAISLCFVLHSTLRHQIDGTRTVETKAVEHASKSADLTDISAMLLVRLDSIHAALDPSELEDAKVDPEALRMSELAREMSEEQP